jgi:hypothetical protein
VWWSSVRIRRIKLFIVDYIPLALCFSIIVSSSGSSGEPENTHIVYKHQAWRKQNPGVAGICSLNPMLAFIAIPQPKPFFVFYRWDSSKIATLHKLCERYPLLDGFTLNLKSSFYTNCIFHWFPSSSIVVFQSS